MLLRHNGCVHQKCYSYTCAKWVRTRDKSFLFLTGFLDWIRWTSTSFPTSVGRSATSTATKSIPPPTSTPAPPLSLDAIRLSYSSKIPLYKLVHAVHTGCPISLETLSALMAREELFLDSRGTRFLYAHGVAIVKNRDPVNFFSANGSFPTQKPPLKQSWTWTTSGLVNFWGQF